MANPKIAVGSLGGTVSMTSNSLQKGVLPKLGAQELIDAIPDVKFIADISSESILKLPSAHMDFDDLLRCLQWAKKQVQEGAKGVVLTQGTDSLEETAFLFDLFWDLPEPLVITGAMRPPQKAGADGSANLLAAIITAAAENSIGRGVLVVMNDWIHEARWVTKMHTSDVDAFQSQVGACGNVFEKKAYYFKAPSNRYRLPVPANTKAKVFLWEASFAETPEVLKWAVDNQYKGLVIAGFGAGHVSEATAELISQLAKQVPVVMSSRTGHGSVAYSTYGYIGAEIDLQARGVIMSGWLTPKKSRLLLWAIVANNLPVSVFDEYLDTLVY